VDLIIRVAQLEDALAMGTVWRRAAMVGYDGIFPPSAPAFPEPEEIADDWRRAITADLTGAAVLVACHDGPDQVILGTIAAMPDADESTRGHLRGLYVDPGHWGRGIGRALHDTALEHFHHAGFRVAAGWVLEANVHVRAMAERWGWRLAPGRRTLYPGVTEVLYLRSV
jgi:GNAT superfamily N-acetyltransferase